MEKLDQDRIAELVAAAQKGDLPEAPASPSRRAHRVRTVDFSRPTKFGADHQRRINRATEMFCQTAVSRLGAELHNPVELEPVSTVQLTWAGVQRGIPAGTLLAVLEAEPIGTRMVLTVERNFVLVCLECLLGGTPERPAHTRRLSEIDWVLARSFIESIVQSLTLIWHELAGIRFRVGEIGEHEPSGVASVSEATYSILLDARINQQSYALGLLLPWASVQPIAGALSGRAPERPANGRPRGVPMEDPMAQVPVTIRTEIAQQAMAVEEILALAPGSTISFLSKAADGVAIYADNVALGVGRAGRHGRRRAVQLVEPTEES